MPGMTKQPISGSGTSRAPGGGSPAPKGPRTSSSGAQAQKAMRRWPGTLRGKTTRSPRASTARAAGAASTSVPSGA